MNLNRCLVSLFTMLPYSDKEWFMAPRSFMRNCPSRLFHSTRLIGQPIQACQGRAISLVHEQNVLGPSAE